MLWLIIPVLISAFLVIRGITLTHGTLAISLKRVQVQGNMWFELGIQFGHGTHIMTDLGPWLLFPGGLHLRTQSYIFLELVPVMSSNSRGRDICVKTGGRE